jgi:hypothetical protein
MVTSKIYLNVPYAQKDAVKALGARWDAANKKWYVPADIDNTLFAKWQSESATLDLPSITTIRARSRASSSFTTISSSANNAIPGVITHAKDKNFVAYNGDEPPWD